MSIWEKSRFSIYNHSQHPLRHNLSDFTYTNPALPGVSVVTDVLDYLIAVIYPNYIGTFATPGDLPLTPNANDYAVVTDDGDGNSAGYVYTVIDSVSQWTKRYDMDWSLDAILSETINKTQYMYVQKEGYDDANLSGDLAGQAIYGGATANKNLTLFANSGDAVGNSGFVQFGDNVRPLVDNTFDLGTSSKRFKDTYSSNFHAGTTSISDGSITDTDGLISFGSTDVTTTGDISGTNITGTTSGVFGDITISVGSIICVGGTIDFGASNLETTGTVTGASGSVFGDVTISDGSIESASGTIDFGANDLVTTGTLGAGDATVTRLDSDNVRIDGNAISVTDVNGNLDISANGTGVINLDSPVVCDGITSTGTVSVTGQLNVDNLRLDGNTLQSTNTDGYIYILPNGVGQIEAGSTLYPTVTDVSDLGKSGKAWNKLWISGAIGGATEITLSDLLALRSTPYRDFGRTTPAVAGDTLFWDAVNGVWLASHPDSEIDHSELTGLTTTDAGHTQFVMLAGRTGGQSIQGGTAASESLTLESTAHATKGKIYFKDDLLPFTNASFSGSWSGTDIGGSSNYIKDVYTKGEFKGFRFENYTSGTLPSASAANRGRAVFATDNNKIYLDSGGSWIVAGVSKFISDTSWNGTDTTKDIVVSSTITDARNALWQLCDNSNDFERVYCVIKAISATTVRVEVTPALPAGSWRLIGIE